MGEADDAAEVIDARGEGYPGEAWITLEYREQKAPPFRELYADSETLAEHAEAAGWECEVFYRDEYGAYVARLIRHAATP